MLIYASWLKKSINQLMAILVLKYDTAYFDCLSLFKYQIVAFMLIIKIDSCSQNQQLFAIIILPNNYKHKP